MLSNPRRAPVKRFTGDARAPLAWALSLLILAAAACSSGSATPTRTVFSPTPGVTPAALTPQPATPTAGLSAPPTSTATSTPATELVTYQVIPAPPERNLYEIGRRLVLRAPDPIPHQASPLPAQLQQGDRLAWTVNRDSGNVSVNARVWLVTENAYWIFQDGFMPDEAGLATAAAQFESVIWPTVTGTFGSIATPGIDGDPRLVIFHGELRSGVAGYFSGDDQYPRSIKPESNQREAIYMSARNLLLGSNNYMATLAHELQHATHWAADAGEESWVNEGLSEVASGLAGYPPGSVEAFLRSPGTSLLEWAPDVFSASPNYGASALFFEYIAAHYGGQDTLRAITAHPADSIAGVEGGLRDRGFDVTFVDVFRDWVVANYADDADGPYSHPNRNTSKPARALVSPGKEVEAAVRPFGTNYYVVDSSSGTLELSFQGDPSGRIFPAEPRSGETCWWGNAGDSINSTLTRRVDLRSVTSATFGFHVWHSIEEDWDYAYITVSTDDGVTWQVIPTQRTTDADPNGAAFGPGITGRSGGWVEDSADLTPFAGREILLSIEYITDDAIHDRGACFDDFSIPELGWSDDTATDGGWEAAGFVLINDRQPVEYLVQVVRDTDNGPATAETVTIGPDGRGTATLSNLTANPGETVVIAVSAVTPDITGQLSYTLVLRVP